MSYDEKVDTFLREMSWYHISKHIPGSPAKPIWNLAEVIKKSTESSESLKQNLFVMPLGWQRLSEGLEY